MNTVTANRRILVVDDEVGVTRALRRSLHREGYEVTVYNDPHLALALLKTDRFDMVISDHLMPGMTGIELLRLCRDRAPDTLRVMLTGQADLSMMAQAINDAEVYRFITKPWNDLELKVTLWTAFEQLDLVRENRRLASLARHQQALLERLGQRAPLPSPG